MQPLQFKESDKILLNGIIQMGCTFCIDEEDSRMSFEEASRSWQRLDSCKVHDIYANVHLEKYCCPETNPDINRDIIMFYQYFIHLATYDPDTGLLYQVSESLEDIYHRCKADMISDDMFINYYPKSEQEKMKVKIDTTDKILQRFINEMETKFAVLIK